MKEVLTTKLQDFGLTDKEARVYMASLELGSATADKISKQAEVNRSTTYVQIEQLMEQGLMSTHEEGKKTLFTAESPDNLKRLYQKRIETLEAEAKQLDTIVPDLNRIFDSAGERPVVRYFQGKEGLVTMRNETLKMKNKEMLVFTSYDDMTKVFTRDELIEFSEARAKKKIYPRVIYTKKGEPVNPIPPIEYRRIDQKKTPFESDIYIFDNKVALASLKGSISGVIIESKAIAISMRTIFELAWTTASDT